MKKPKASESLRLLGETYVPLTCLQHPPLPFFFFLFTCRPLTLLVTWIINSPSMLWVRVAVDGWSAEGELERLWELTALASGLFFFLEGGRAVARGRSAKEPHSLTHTHTHTQRTTWLACPVCTQPTRQAANPAGDQQPSPAQRGLQAKKTTRTRRV